MQKSLNVEKRKLDHNSPWLILIHGLFGDLDNLAVVRRHFESTYNILNIDLPDHGRSINLDTFSFELWVELLASTLADHHIEECYVLGHSLGGKLAMQMALAQPEKVKGLMVADIAPVRYPPRHQQVFNGINNVELTQITTRQEADNQLARYISEPGVRQFLLKSLVKNEKDKWQWRFNVHNLREHYDAICDWPESQQTYNGPTLFIKGELSDYLTLEHQSTVLKYFPNSSAKIIQAAGHWLHAEKPQAFNRGIERFLNQQH
ncbi:alpha/beta fold hydrolase [Alteromonas sp. ASW11-130]|uniref:alpha/beta fold hydrolase n=1 Tax=Alteromonas sp. ASW11-130 TaxID=3015775 RepID=UPI0022424098|nr:alpha/beta fold hydrolase [Alteromonas sp. ASW11-130]MCW8092048.1 alpha/beta fold hydrolase [Alteromonas sp. ASW11-130]